MAAEQVASAAQSFEKALKADPGNLTYMLALGNAQTKNKRPNRAVEVLLQAAKMEPNNGLVSQELCEAYKKKGFYRVSIDHCEKAIKVLPNSTPVMNRLAWLYAKKKTKLAKAQRLSRKAVKSDPQNHRYLDTLAEVYYVRGKTDRAVATIKKALEIDADNRLYKQQLWRFKHIKATPKKAEATIPAETTEPADAEPPDSEVVNPLFDPFGAEPEESNPESSEPTSVTEEL